MFFFISFLGFGKRSFSALAFKSNHPESADVDKEVKFYKQNKIPYKVLRDGEVIIVNGNKEKIFRNKK